jgi:hypothetical protein
MEKPSAMPRLKNPALGYVCRVLATPASPLLGHRRRPHSPKVRDVMELGQGHFARAIDQRLATLCATRSLSATRRSAVAHASAGTLFPS